MMKQLLLFTGLILFALGKLSSQVASSYIYLEGIRTIPFRLKVNNKEIPIRNKQYYLVPIQESGEYVMDILFAGDLYPAQRFILDANSHSAFGYKLAKTVEDKFYLVDLVNKGRIIETNSDVNIGLSTIENTINFSNTLVLKDSVQTEEKLTKKQRRKLQQVSEAKSLEPVETTVTKEPEPKVVKEKKKNKKVKDTLAVNIEEPKKDPVYGVVEEIKAKPKKEKKKPEVAETKKEKVEVAPVKKMVVPTCSGNASDPEVNSLVNRLKNKSNDEDRMMILRKKVFTGCITCTQLHRIVEELNSQFDRMNAVKFLRNSISDIQNLVQLEDLFKTDTNKAKLTNLMYQ